MTARRQPRVVMLFRGGVRNNPRVIKEAVTLCEAGYRVIVVAIKVPGETDSIERLERNLIIVRTQTGVVRRIGRGLRRLRLRQPDASGRNQGAVKRAGAEAARIPPWRLGLMLISRFLMAMRMAALALRVKPEAVHAHDFGSLPAACLTGAIAKVPIVYDAHEVNVDREGYYRQLRSLVYRAEFLLIRRCARVITTTDTRARHFRRLYHLRRTPTVLQNRPLFARVRPKEGLRAALGVPDGALLCIYQGGLQEGRGLRNVVRAVALANGVHCVLLGSGHQSEAVQRLIQELGVGDRIHLHPKVTLREVPSITAAADVGLQTIRNTCFNHWSTDSNKLFEYAMAGLCVVASDFPEIRKVVKVHELGLLVNPECVTDISKALCRLRDDRQLLRTFKEHSRTAGPALSWNSQAPALLALYADLFPAFSGSNVLGASRVGR